MGRPVPLVEAPLRRATLLYGAPIAAALTLHGLFNLVDLIVIGRLGRDGLVAAANFASILNTAPLLLFDGVCNAGVAHVARAKGAGDDAAAAATARRLGILAVIAAAAACFPFYPAAALLFDAFCAAEPAAAAGGADFLRISTLGSASMFLLMAATAALRGVGAVRAPVLLLVGANAANVALDVALVHGLWGFPRLEAAGAAWATVVARTAACLVAFECLRRGAGGLRAAKSVDAGAGAGYRRLLVEGLPTAAQLVVRVAAIFVGMALAVRAAGASAGAVFDGVNVAQRLDMIPTFAALGFGAAATAAVGQNLGAGRPDRARGAAAWTALYATAGTALLCALLWIFRGALFSLIEPGLAADRVAAAEQYWRWTLPALPAMAAGAVFARALNGAHDVRTPLFVDVACYLVATPVAAGALGAVWGPAGVWGGVACGHVCATAAYAVALRRALPVQAALS